MDVVALRTALRHVGTIAQKPMWIIAALAHGSRGAVKRAVSDSIEEARANWRNETLEEVVDSRPVTVLGRLGAPQEYLYRIVRSARPRKVIETGVDRGISSAFILAALHDNRCGDLYSIDLPTARYQVPTKTRAVRSNVRRTETVGYAVPESLRGSWHLIIGDVRSELPSLARGLGTIDMFYHDSEHTYSLMLWEYTTASSALRKDGLLVSDDVNWNSAFPDYCRHSGLRIIGTVWGRLGVATNAS